MEVNGKAKRTSLKDSKNCENAGKFFCYYNCKKGGVLYGK